MSAKDLWKDCTEHCISQKHGDYLGAAVTLREPADRELASFFSLLCGNVGCVTDSFGRTVLHLAASLGRRELAQWLIQKCEANANVQDRESGYTPLHRSIFYGQLNVAVILIQMGADINIRDCNFLTPIELAMKDRPPEVKFSTNFPCEIYVWGTNTNYNLGTDNIQGRQQPELLDFFRKQNQLISIIQVYMDKFHTVLVSACGRVWTCGHGQGGRLGLGSERTCLAPMQVQLGSVTKSSFQNAKSIPGNQEVCVACAAGRDHTILLMESYTVLVFGLNTHHVLGLTPPPAKVLEPHRLPMKYLDDLKFPPQGVCAGRYHSVIWSKGEILTFGLNGGQLGHPKSLDRTIITPKPVNALFYKDVEITHVASSDGAIVVSTGNRHIWVLHEYQKSKLSMRYSLEIEQVAVVGGHLDYELDLSNLSEKGEPLKVAAISKEGSVFLWQEKDLQMTRCILSPSRQLKITNIQLNLSKSAMLLVTDDGEAYSGEIKPVNQKMNDIRLIKGRRPHTQPNYDGECHVLYKQADKNHLKIFLDPDLCYSVHLQRLPNAHRAIKVASDPKGRNFALIQTHPSAFISNVPELPPEKQGLREDLCNLLNEANEWDCLHDIIFEVDHKHFYAHQFIVSRHSNILLRMIQDAKEACSKGNKLVIKVHDVSSDLFENFLLFMYSGDCSLTQPTLPLDSPDENIREGFNRKRTSSQKVLENEQQDNDMSNPLTQARIAAKKLGLIKFIGQLNLFKYEDGKILWAHSTKKKMEVLKPEVIQLEWNAVSEFSDIKITSKDGVSFSLHKCVLAARSEYFHNMLGGGWIESQGTRDLLLPLDQLTLSVLFDYIYKDITPSLDKVGVVDFDLAMNCLIAADLLLINPFKIRCEAALASLLTLRNVKVVLELATTYNAPDLQDCCYQFICLNLSALLETGMLIGLTPSVLDGLRDYYCDLHHRMACRIITPFSTGPSIDFVKELAACNLITWDEDINFESPDEPEGQKKNRYSSKKKRFRRTSDNLKLRHRADSVGSTNSDDMDSLLGLEPLDWSDIVEKEESSLNESMKKISLEETSDNKEKAEKRDHWIKVISSSKASKTVQARLKAAAIVREEMMEIVSSPPKHQSPVTTLMLHPYPASPQSPPQQVPNQSINTNHPKSISPEIMEKHFPQLGGNDVSRGSPKVSFVPASFTNEKRPLKLSQKQRKKLALEEGEAPPSPVPIPARGWEIREEMVTGSPSSLSLADIMQEQLKRSKQTTLASKPINIKQSPSASHHTPWGKIDNTLSPPSSLSVPVCESSPEKCDSSVNFSDIVADEMKQRENWTRMRAKPLSLTQIEDRAIDDLITFYNANEACEERITVRRVLSSKVARPVWVTSKNRDSFP